MSVPHPQFGLREIKPTYWYTTSQINDLGTRWASAQPFRTFCSTEVVGTIGLQSLNENLLNHLPHEIVCPINKGGNHWTSLAIQLSRNSQGHLVVNLGYADSLDSSSELPMYLEEEMLRLFMMFSKLDPHLEWRPSVYKHRWQQNDGCSCGVYALENAFRFLANAGAQPNPGAQYLREKQLQQMSMPIAITGCSTSMKVDDMLRVWMQKGEPIESLTSDALVSFLFEYADLMDEDVSVLTEFMKRELLHNLDTPNINFLVHPLHVRIKELVPTYSGKTNHRVYRPPFVPVQETSRVVSKANDTELAPPVRPKALDSIYTEKANYPVSERTFVPAEKTIQAASRANHAEFILPADENEFDLYESVRHLQTMMEVFHTDVDQQEKRLIEILTHLYQGHVDLVVQAFTSFHKDAPIPIKELALITSLAATSSQQNAEWKKMGEACDIIQSASELLEACKKNIKTIDYESGKSMLDSHIKLLNFAIRRGDANIFWKVCYAINDAFSALLKFISFGLWTPAYEQIDVIKQKLMQQSGGSDPLFFKNTLIEEIGVLDACIQAQEKIQQASEDLKLIQNMNDDDNSDMDSSYSSLSL